MPYQLASGLLYKANALLVLEDDTAKTYLRQAQKALADAMLIIENKNFKKLNIDSYQINATIALKEGENLKAQNILEEYTSIMAALKTKNSSLVAAIYIPQPNVVEIQEQITLPTVDQEPSDQEKSESFNVITNGLSIAIIAILSLLTSITLQKQQP